MKLMIDAEQVAAQAGAGPRLEITFDFSEPGYVLLTAGPTKYRVVRSELLALLAVLLADL